MMKFHPWQEMEKSLIKEEKFDSGRIYGLKISGNPKFGKE